MRSATSRATPLPSTLLELTPRHSIPHAPHPSTDSVAFSSQSTAARHRADLLRSNSGPQRESSDRAVVTTSPTTDVWHSHHPSLRENTRRTTGRRGHSRPPFQHSQERLPPASERKTARHTDEEWSSGRKGDRSECRCTFCGWTDCRRLDDGDGPGADAPSSVFRQSNIAQSGEIPITVGADYARHTLEPTTPPCAKAGRFRSSIPAFFSVGNSGGVIDSHSLRNHHLPMYCSAGYQDRPRAREALKLAPLRKNSRCGDVMFMRIARGATP